MSLRLTLLVTLLFVCAGVGPCGSDPSPTVTTVTEAVSKPLDPAPDPPPEKIILPRLVGQSASEARHEIAALGLDLATVTAAPQGLGTGARAPRLVGMIGRSGPRATGRARAAG